VPTLDEILTEYRGKHDVLSSPYYTTKRLKARSAGVYLATQTLCETAQRRILRETTKDEQDAVRQRFLDGALCDVFVVRECDENMKFDGRPYRRFADLSPETQDATWEMILDEDEFNFAHQDIWIECGSKLRVRLDELVVKGPLSGAESEEKAQLEARASQEGW